MSHTHHKSNTYHRARTKPKRVAEVGVSVKAQSAVLHCQANLS